VNLGLPQVKRELHGSRTAVVIGSATDWVTDD
jgi:hypothetical protein